MRECAAAERAPLPDGVGPSGRSGACLSAAAVLAFVLLTAVDQSGGGGGLAAVLPVFLSYSLLDKTLRSTTRKNPLHPFTVR
ncbi:hypothetical protein GJAV_G00120960 [Gymnothorax javanicus]|nr:hypothetical protein GJAV_G00120960 [Gymnothorax javanicus]